MFAINADGINPTPKSDLLLYNEIINIFINDEGCITCAILHVGPIQILQAVDAKYDKLKIFYKLQII